MSIINHSIYNYSGRELNIYQKTGDYKSILISKDKNFKIRSIKPDNFYDIEIDNNDDYFLNKKKEKKLSSNYIKLYVENAHVSNHIIQIDNLQKKYHRVNFNEIYSLKDYLVNMEERSFFTKYCFLISKIELQGLKKIIYFYSPLVFSNKTIFNFEIKINNNLNKTKLYQLLPNETIGIPFEYLNGTMEIKLEGCTEVKKFSIYKDFLLPEVIIDSNIGRDNKLNNDEIEENINYPEYIKNVNNQYILKELTFIDKFNLISIIFFKNGKSIQISYVNLSFNNPQENKYLTEFDYSTNTPIDKLTRIINLCTSYTLLNFWHLM